MAITQRVTGEWESDGLLIDARGLTLKAEGSGGFVASDLLLASVAGCSSATLQALLKRDSLQVTSLRVSVEGDRLETTPRVYTDIRVHYVIKSPGLTAERLAHYVDIVGKACPVIQSVKARVLLTFQLL
jgi:putative redox protein